MAKPLFATTYNIVVNNGLWSTPTTWTPIGVPGPGDFVQVTNMTVVLDDSYSIGRLNFNSGAIIGIGTLTLQDPFGVNSWTSGTLGGSVVLDIGVFSNPNSFFEWFGGSLIEQAELRVPTGGNLFLFGGLRTIADDSQFLIQTGGQVSWITGELELEGNGLIDCDGLFEVQLTHTITTTNYTGDFGLIIHDDGIVKAANITLAINAPVNNDGTLHADNGVIHLTDSLQNSGEILLQHQQSQLSLGGGATRVFTTGTQILGSGSIDQDDGMSTFLATVPIEPSFDVQGGTLNGPAELVITNSIEMHNCTVDLNLTITPGGSAYVGSNAHFTDKTYQFNGFALVYPDGDEITMESGGIINQTGTMQARVHLCCGNPFVFSRSGPGPDPVINNIGTFQFAWETGTLTGEVPDRSNGFASFTNIQFNNTGTIAGGTLCVTFVPMLNVATGTIAPSVILPAPGSPISEFIILGDLDPAGNLLIDIQDENGPGIGHDVVTVSGDLVLCCTLTVSLIGSPIPAFHEIARCDGSPTCRTGQFVDVNLPPDYFIFYTDTSAVVMSSLLPLELSHFSGKTLVTGNRLDWQTESENHSDRFEIERSDDQASWFKIGEMPAAGLSAGPISYFFEDKLPVRAAWYRLRMVDEDGSFAFSPIVFLERNEFGDGAFSISPNPVSGDGFQLKMPETAIGQPVELRLFDVVGRLVFEKNLEEAEAAPFIFMEKPLAAGSYFLEVISEKMGQRLPVIFR